MFFYLRRPSRPAAPGLSAVLTPRRAMHSLGWDRERSCPRCAGRGIVPVTFADRSFAAGSQQWVVCPRCGASDQD
ncbi:hypothetical protein [Microlunatus endophyticus]